MVDADRRPTAQEIEELIDLVRRDAGSPAFIDLGEAYLALGRPRDAIQVGTMGLEASPDSHEGRVMLARAYAALHQWKDAQGELLRVVKVDRGNRVGFALLGEVLMRRDDYERAIPVLQHAQNLDPTSPRVLGMLKRARGGQPLDPPPPVPTPVPPRGETESSLPIQRSYAASAPPADPPPVASRPHHVPAPPQTASLAAGVRPRVISSDKQHNAAAASLRQSAAVGENYLNDLLTGGLLEVAGVRVPDQDFDLRPERRWGRSTRRAFAFLFVILVLGIGGGGTWYYWSEQQRAEAVARLQNEAQKAIGSADFAGLELALRHLGDALEKDNDNLVTFAYVAQAAGLEALLYGTDADRVKHALKAIGTELPPGRRGSREALIGRAAVDLARLGTGDGDAAAIATTSKSTVATTIQRLDELLARSPGDKWALWLKGRALLAAGERKAARAALAAASDGADAVLPAIVDHADLLVDDGSLTEAIASYDKVTAAAKDHPLAVAGRALGRAEANVQISEAIDELSVKLDKNFGPRVAAYRSLALALANAGIEDFPKAAASLARATAVKPPNEPRFWARVAWAHYIAGNLAEAARARSRIAWYGKASAEDDPTVQHVDAALLLASGLPDKALELASKLEGVRAKMLRAYALIDLGKSADAVSELEAVLEAAPENVEAEIAREHARMLGGDAAARRAATDKLEKLARRAKSKLGRHALGTALLATGDVAAARPQLEQAITDVGETSPNPLAYRTHTALAEMFFAAGDLAAAGKHLDQALALNSGYFPTLALQARVVLRVGDADRALDLLDPIFKEVAAITPALKLTLAEALIVSKKTSAKQKEQAKALLIEIKDQITPATEVGRVAALLDPKLPKELGVPEAEAPPPGAPVKPTGKPKPPVRKRRR